jgi:paraquat-inducible protein A
MSPTDPVALVACSVCDMPQYVRADAPSRSLQCWCCGAVVHRAADWAPEETLALVVAAAIYFVFGNVFPVVAIEANGTAATSTLIGAAHALYVNGMTPVAIVVVLMTVLLPAIELVCLGALLLSRRSSSLLQGTLLRVREYLLPWSMVEIFVLGSVVAIVKLGDFAHISLGIGMWALAAFMILNAAAKQAFAHTDFWAREPHA